MFEYGTLFNIVIKCKPDFDPAFLLLIKYFEIDFVFFTFRKVGQT